MSLDRVWEDVQEDGRRGSGTILEEVEGGQTCLLRVRARLVPARLQGWTLILYPLLRLSHRATIGIHPTNGMTTTYPCRSLITPNLRLILLPNPSPSTSAPPLPSPTSHKPASDLPCSTLPLLRLVPSRRPPLHWPISLIVKTALLRPSPSPRKISQMYRLFLYLYHLNRSLNPSREHRLLPSRPPRLLSPSPKHQQLHPILFPQQRQQQQNPPLHSPTPSLLSLLQLPFLSQARRTRSSSKSAKARTARSTRLATQRRAGSSPSSGSGWRARRKGSL
jgi:hypothetical protein